jgi:hypothetical protein
MVAIVLTSTREALPLCVLQSSVSSGAMVRHANQKGPVCMPTKPEIIQAINAGIERVDQTFGNLSDEQLATKVHDGENGWTAKQVLAHLAGRAETHDMMSKMAQGAPPPDGPFDVNTWNQRIVDDRADASRDDLLTEFRAAHERLAARVEGMPDAMLEMEITTPRGTSTMGEVLMGSGGMHSISHAEEVEQALK